MNALARITDAGFEVWLKDNGNLGIKPFHALTAEQLEYLKTNKAEIIKELAATSLLFAANHIDDRHHCRECRHMSNSGYCTQQRFRPVDDIPRRCADFSGLSPVIEQRAEKKTSEAEHNAQGRYFKFLITRQDGSQFYSCSMPRMALEEVREQYPDAAGIEPVSGENYDEKLNTV